MKDYPTEKIRNLVLLGHGGTGKTTLAEAALFVSGAINRMGKVEDGTTTSDFDPDEVKRKVSINASILPTEWKDRKLNFIDAPGYADFIGDAYSGLAAADAAVVVVCGASGVQVGTEQAWGMAEQRGIPRAIVINRMDRENANFAATLEQVRSVLSKRCVPIHLPIGSQDSFKGVIDVVDMKAFLGDKAAPADLPEDMADQISSAREALLEVVAEADDDLTMKYLEGEELTPDEVRQGLEAGIASGTVVPVMVASGAKVVGLQPLLDAIARYFPSPAARTVTAKDGSGAAVELKADVSGPLAAQVFKTTADPYVGKLTYLRVFSGVLKADSHVWNANKNADERVGQLFMVRGKTQEPVQQLIAGDIGAVAKLDKTVTSDTLTLREKPIILPPIAFPSPTFNVAVYPRSKADTEKMSTALARITEEDPVLRVQRDPDTGETILSGLGESHVEIAVEKMKRKFGADIVLQTPKVPYKETITTAASAEYTHKKQTGGHGQYAKVLLSVEPLPRGAGFEFVNKVVGGNVPKQYIPAVEAGVVEALQEGALAHCQMVDLRVTLLDGKDHPVDSSEMAFKLAGSQALKACTQKARPVLLEPILNVRVKAPEAYTGDIVSDLNGKRARVLGITPEDGVTVIDAQAPAAEMLRYSTDLRSLTQGRATFEVSFDHYEEVPEHVAKKVVEAAEKERAAAHA
ncbi:MAG TPA: elongation factor G [Dehalococcoidia bacterium]|nr:elongation factor G [Dehalococcoidia bacterium]